EHVRGPKLTRLRAKLKSKLWAHCRWAKICSNWELIGSIEWVLVFVSETSGRRSLGFLGHWWCRLYSPCRMLVRDMHRSASRKGKICAYGPSVFFTGSDLLFDTPED